MKETRTPPQSLTGCTVVFDLDGTLIESAPDLLSALNETIAPLGVAPVILDDIRDMIGHGAKAMITSALQRAEQALPEPEDMDAMWTRFLAHYSDNIFTDSFLFDGVVDALDSLAALGATLAVCTNKTQALSDKVLAQAGIADRFAAIIGADSVPSKKPDGAHILATLNAAKTSPERAIMIGDSQTDEKAALNAGLPFIFVPFGYEAAPAEQITCVATLRHYSELSERVLAELG